MSTLLIDDLKTAEDIRDNFGCEFDLAARNFEEAISALSQRYWQLVLLDHDLADNTGPGGEERKGVHVVRWLARPENRQHIPARIVCVSRNSVGIGNINAEIDMLYSDPDQLLMLDSEYLRRYYENLS
jgi:hypothetical protein